MKKGTEIYGKYDYSQDHGGTEQVGRKWWILDIFHNKKS